MANLGRAAEVLRLSDSPARIAPTMPTKAPQTRTLAPWQQLRAHGRPSANDLITMFGIVNPPVDVAMIARRLGAQLRVAPKPGWAGAVRVIGNAATIWLRAEDHPVRRRFTIAHELGHLLLHSISEAYRDNEHFSGSPLEWEANRFAADLLMPMKFVDRWAMARGTNPQDFAAAFLVSEEAARIRLQEWEVL